MYIDRNNLIESLSATELYSTVRIFVEALDCHFNLTDFGHSTILGPGDSPMDNVYLDSELTVGGDWGPDWAKYYAMEFLREGPTSSFRRIVNNLNQWWYENPKDRLNIEILATILTNGDPDAYR